jgi:hypothetical protein
LGFALVRGLVMISSVMRGATVSQKLPQSLRQV